MSRGTRGAALIMVLAVVASLQMYGSPPASAATDGKLVLVLDSSGSMKEKVGGQTKISIAKRALNTVIGKLPADAQVGMRVYGATVFDRKDKGACTDSQLVVGIGTGNRDALRTAVSRYKPYGETPISYSLKQAAQDLGSTGRRTVVLVSDGEETCNTDPCVTAANLAKKGIDLKFDVIGLRVSGKARSQLQCVADKGNGTYYDADNADEIEDSLDKLATRAFRPFKLSGVPVRGSTDESSATEVTPGQYVDRFPGVDDDVYYRVKRTQPGSTLYVGLTAEAAGFVPTAALHFSSDLTTCPTGLGQVVNVLGTRNVVSAQASSWSSKRSSACNQADELLITLTHNEALAARPFELLVREEPPVADTRDLPPADERARWQKMSPAAKTVKAPVPGVSLSDSPLIAPGTYTGSILTGEKQVYAVDLDWGQQLQTQLTVAPRRGALADALGVLDSIDIQVLGPMRGTYDRSTLEGKPSDSGTMVQDEKTYRVSAGTPQIRYLNRNSYDSQRYAALAGRQYVVISKSRSRDQKQFLVPYTFTVGVTGTAGDGAPDYQQPSPSPTPTPPSATAVPSAQPSTPPSTAPSGGGVPVAAVVGIGVGALVLGGLIAAAATWAARRRRPR